MTAPHRRDSDDVLRLTRLAVVAGLLAVFALPALAAEDDDDEDEPPLPGLAARYESGGDKPVAFDRYDPLPRLLLAAGEAPDPRLPAGGWRVTWKGQLYVRSPGRYEFSGRTSGKLAVRIDGRPVLDCEPQEGRPVSTAGAPLELGFGLHQLEVTFAQRGDGAELKLSWKSDDFALEALPAFVVGHSRAEHGSEPDRFVQGRLLAEEHNCIRCHLPADQAPLSRALASRPGPKLTDAGSRLDEAWIYHWLEDPRAFRPEAVMPRMFAADGRGMIERRAVAAFLASRGKPPRPRRLDRNQSETWPAQGQALFESLGCLVCHEKQGEAAPRATLAGLGQKTTPAALANFLRDPHAIAPAGRMPGFSFADPNDPWRLALYLISRDADKQRPLARPGIPVVENIRGAMIANGMSPSEMEALAKQPEEDQLRSLGRLVMRAKRCTACHELQIDGEEQHWQPRPANRSFADIARRPRAACNDWSRQPEHDGIPSFAAPIGSPLEKVRSRARPGKVIAEFLVQARSAPGTPAPGETARLTIERLNCTGCHERNGQGGLSESIVARLTAAQTEQNADAVLPPPLSGIAEKLLAPAIRQVLEGHQRSRPWLSMQMPRFDAAQVAPLPAAIAADDGEPLHSDSFQPPADPALIDAGRQLVGEKGFSCAKCHDMLGIPNSGTRGPDLANVPGRVTYDWYERWITSPQRLQPGTRMPSVFYGGKSAAPHVLDGVPQQQLLAMWQYLLVCRSLPYPEGVKPPGKLSFPASGEVQVVRTFLPELSARAIAIRSPQGLHLAFDAQACRLGYAWSGEFLDMRPVWDGRGGNPAGLEGALFWKAPDGFPWDVTASAAEVPDFSGRGSDTALGAIVPQDGKLHPSRLSFRTLRPQAAQTTLSYDFELGDDRRASFTETVSTFRTELATGIARDCQVRTPPGQFVWLNVALADQPPDWQVADGARGTLEGAGQTAVGSAVLSFVQNGRRYVIDQSDASGESDWLAVRRGEQWSVVLRLPARGEPAQGAIRLRLLKPLDDQPETQSRVAKAELGDSRRAPADKSR